MNANIYSGAIPLVFNQFSEWPGQTAKLLGIQTFKLIVFSYFWTDHGGIVSIMRLRTSSSRGLCLSNYWRRRQAETGQNSGQKSLPQREKPINYRGLIFKE